MTTSHSHDHPARRENRRRLSIVLVLVGAYMLAEIAGGLISNSLALLADAGHMLADVAALALSLFAIRIAQRPPTAKRTYGYYRAEILAALANGAALVVICVFVFIEAYHRLDAPPHVAGGLMMGIALGGLVVNLIGLALLHEGRSSSLNVRGAWLHVLGDTLGSVGAIAAGVLIWTLGWNWADPLASVLIAALILYSSWALLRETVSVLLEGAPGHIDVEQVRESIAGLHGVSAVHDLHVWSITSGMVSLSCHIVACDGPSRQTLLESMNQLLKDRFAISHTTIQIEPEGLEGCDTCR